MKAFFELRNNHDAFVLFAKNFLRKVAHAAWKASCKTRVISQFCTIGDEAFALLTLENNYLYWMAEANMDVDKPKPRYTGNGPRNSWSRDGILCYEQIRNIVEQNQDEHKDNPQTELFIRNSLNTKKSPKAKPHLPKIGFSRD